jgi:hypothetical protein
MADTIIFRGARIRYVDVRREKEGGVFTRLHLAADYSPPVREAMDWGDMPECVSSARLNGALTAQNLILLPNAKELRQHEIQVECTEVNDFAVHSLKDDEGEYAGTELRFIARSVQPGVAAILENYLRVIGNGDGQLKVSYVKQGKLFGEDEKKETAAATENLPDVAPEQVAPLEPEIESANLGSLAPAAVAHGNTAEMRKARRARQQSAKPIPSAADAPEWRTPDEIAAGVPHHVDTEALQ